MEEVCGYFRRTMSAQAQDQAKLDDRLHPVPDEVFGSAEHTPADQLRHYEKLGELTQLAGAQLACIDTFSMR